MTQRRRQTKDSLGAVEFRTEIALRKARQRVIVLGCFEQVGSQRGIKDKALKAPPFVHKQTHQFFQRMGGFADLIAEQQIQHAFIILAAQDMADGINLPAVTEFERRQPLFPRQHRDQFGIFQYREKLRYLLGADIHARQCLHCALSGRDMRGDIQSPALDQTREAQAF